MAAPEGVLAFDRSLPPERVRCYFELSGKSCLLEDLQAAAGTPLHLSGGATITADGLRLPPYAAAAVRL